MSYRAQEIGATLSVGRARDKGTVVLCRLPRAVAAVRA